MKQRMIQRAFPKADSPPERRPLAVQASFRRHGVALGVVALGLAPIACLSDVTFPDCTAQHPCGGAGSAGSEAGAPPEHGGSGGEGNVGVVDSGGSGEAGASGDAGASGSAGTPNGGNGGNGGVGGNGGGVIPCEHCQFSPLVVPAPCGTNPYSTTLNMGGGTAPYSNWQITPPVDGWHIAYDPAKADNSRVVLSGEHPTATQLTLDVTDAIGEHATRTFSIAPRTSCWFAYTALETDGPELHVLDPILELPPPTPLVHNQGVYDFAFSPNGKYLAYRFGADASNPKGKHLALVDLSTWNDQLLTFAEDAVTAFAWSPDSAVLAVAFSSSGKSYLGGFRPGASAPQGELTPTAAAVDSDLDWLAGSRLAFFASGKPDPFHFGHLVASSSEVTAFYAQLGDAGFDSIVMSTDSFYDVPAFMQPSSDGFFMISPSGPYMQFNWLTDDGPVGTFYLDDFIAPSGHFTAELSSNQLQLFRAEDDTQVAASSSGQDCPKFLTWAKRRERMACVADVPANAEGITHSEVRIFDLDSANNLSMSTIQGYCAKKPPSLIAGSACAALEYDYSEASADSQPRVFSPSGQYFAFETASTDSGSNYFYVAHLDGPPFTLKRKDTVPTSGPLAPSQLAFSPDEHYVLQQLGTILSVYTVEGGTEGTGTTSLTNFYPDPTQPTACSEDFASAPDRWCGSASRAAPFAWSADSRFVAYRSKDITTPKKTLSVVDLAQFPGTDSHIFFATDCVAKCSGQFVFQPQP